MAAATAITERKRKRKMGRGPTGKINPETLRTLSRGEGAGKRQFPFGNFRFPVPRQQTKNG